jgi:hypothetical protein
MAEILNILVLPTYDVETIAITDISVYSTDPPTVTSPTIEITVPGYTTAVSLTFVVETTNIFNSTDLGLTVAGSELPLPDGVYCLKYTVDPAATNYVEKTIMRVDKIQEKFDEAFMKLDMMECDRAIKNQEKINLNTIYFLIQGAIAAANNCAVIQSITLYQQADTMLDNFILTNCGCTGSNYTITFS